VAGKCRTALEEGGKLACKGKLGNQFKNAGGVVEKTSRMRIKGETEKLCEREPRLIAMLNGTDKVLIISQTKPSKTRKECTRSKGSARHVSWVKERTNSKGSIWGVTARETNGKIPAKCERKGLGNIKLERTRGTELVKEKKA